MEPGFWGALANLDIRTVFCGVLLLMLFASWTAVFYAILRGKLLPKSTVDRLLGMSHEREQDWKAAHATSEEIRSNVAEQVQALTVTSEATARILSALPIKRGGS